MKPPQGVRENAAAFSETELPANYRQTLSLSLLSVGYNRALNTASAAREISGPFAAGLKAVLNIGHDTLERPGEVVGILLTHLIPKLPKLARVIPTRPSSLIEAGPSL